MFTPSERNSRAPICATLYESSARLKRHISRNAADAFMINPGNHTALLIY